MADTLELDPNLITIGNRQRREVGNISDLEESIARIGVLQPIVIDSNNNLIAGGRRLQCCRNLNIPIPVRYIDSLSPLELKILELEENIKRSDLPWKDQAKAIFDIHQLNEQEHGASNWSIAATARTIGLSPNYTWRIILVHRNIDDPRISGATSLEQAALILYRVNERRAASVVGEILNQGASLFGDSNAGDSEAVTGDRQSSTEILGSIQSEDRFSSVSVSSEINIQEGLDISSDTFTGAPPPSRVLQTSLLNQDFISWVSTYSGPKFNLIHCDFPYGTAISGAQRSAEYDSTPELYENLCTALANNFERLASYSAHVIFWFSMTTYHETLMYLKGLGLWVYPYPLVWTLTDGARIVPVVGKTPRRAYHTAFLASRGERPTVKSINDSYAGPTVAKPIHPTQKSEAMLKHFLSLIVDDTSIVLDPTCGSASALIAAESLGARQVLGLEADVSYFKAAESALNQARALRRLSGA